MPVSALPAAVGPLLPQPHLLEALRVQRVGRQVGAHQALEAVAELLRGRRVGPQRGQDRLDRRYVAVSAVVVKVEPGCGQAARSRDSRAVIVARSSDR